jgi:2-dehydro-3-deoxygluconokinase
MGLRARWVSRLPDDGRGRRVARSLAAHGVDVSGVVWDRAPGARVGVFFVEAGAAPRATEVIYDRADSAASRLAPADLPADLIATCRHLHVTGITPALSESCARAVAHAVGAAKRLGRTVSLDVNYRARLWPPGRAAETLGPLLPQADLLITAADDVRLLWDIAGTGAEVAAALRARFGPPAVAVTLGADGVLVDDGSAAVQVAAPPVAEMVDRLGAGDAFAAGLLTGFLEDRDLARGARLGMAMASLKLTLPGDEFFCTRAEVEALAAGETVTTVRR